jgi:DNA-binding transcriptional regulator LsrR (DeoR family)
MQTQTDLTMLYRIARYYYRDCLSQIEIAERENISSSQISCLFEKVVITPLNQSNINYSSRVFQAIATAAALLLVPTIIQRAVGSKTVNYE